MGIFLKCGENFENFENVGPLGTLNVCGLLGGRKKCGYRNSAVAKKIGCPFSNYGGNQRLAIVEARLLNAY